VCVRACVRVCVCVCVCVCMGNGTRGTAVGVRAVQIAVLLLYGRLL
jgi:hypothetical protein